jgi:paraquat-inducible protein A
MEQDNYIACEVCDTLHHKHHLTGLASARCSRCGSTLYRHVGLRSADRELAIAFAALITFLIANAFPIVELEANGITTRTTLIGAVLNLIDGDRTLIAGMVATVTIAFPFVEMMALIYLLMPLRLGHKPRGFDFVLRTIQAVRPWGMIEVFMLGVLITVVKMTSLARVIPEIAMFAFGALTFLIAALVTFDPRDLWDLADETIVRITALRLHAARSGTSTPTPATATATAAATPTRSEPALRADNTAGATGTSGAADAPRSADDERNTPGRPT